jgi:hypothetical protein
MLGKFARLLGAIVVVSWAGDVMAQGRGPGDGLAIASDIAARRAQFVPKKLDADLSALDAREQKALGHLVAAAREVDAIFFRQSWQGNPAFTTRVAQLSSPGADVARDYFRIMMGPWDRIKDNEPFVGAMVHPPGGGFYPEDMSKAEYEAWLIRRPEDRKSFESSTTVIRRQGERLVAIGYSKEYREFLERAASELRAAAEATANASLRNFLRLRADAFLSDDYYASDLAWMDLDSPIEVVIGPYETYEDGLFGYKAAFEAFVCVEQGKESARLAKYKKELPYLEKSLPIGKEHKNRGRGAEAPIRVVDSLLTAGDARRGVQTLAFNLPNDERVRAAKGSKNVLIKNVMRAKYEAILEPIAARVLPAADLRHLDFESYFHFILFHELSHGIGPGRITVNGRETEVRRELKELYSGIEEAKADIVGVHSLYLLVDRGIVDKAIVAPLPWTYLAGLFRSVRFGTGGAHGLGVVIQTNYLLGKGAITITPDGRFSPVPVRFRAAIRDLAHELLMVDVDPVFASDSR